jgi:UDP-N-acetylglucosamine acyltransferase
MTIHERALVHPKAKIGEGTVVGPDAYVDEHVEIGPQCEIRARAYITGHTKLGARNQVGVGAVIGTEPQDLAYKGEKSFVEIGDDNIFREYSTIHRGTKEGTATRIGNKNLIMVGAHIAHNCAVGNNVILVNNVLLAGYVEVHDHAFLGGDAVVHQFTRIGKYVMVRGQTRLGCDVPPYFMAVDTNIVHGLNRVGLKRAGFDQARRRAVQKAYNLLYFDNKNRMQAIEALKTDPELRDFQDIRDLVQFLETTKRGICRPATTSGPSEGIED